MMKIVTLLVVLALIIWRLRKWSQDLSARSLNRLTAGEQVALDAWAEKNRLAKRALASRRRLHRAIVAAKLGDTDLLGEAIDGGIRALAASLDQGGNGTSAQEQLVDALDALGDAVHRRDPLEAVLRRLTAARDALTVPPAERGSSR
ncbi:MAG: hypothetical protein IT384_02370 [Deltaproteobacteria bacterium]|nr:hypothetical protein [Deltaproteobacteria bacterium]